MSVSYTRVNWVNGTTAVNQTNMNKMDKGIADCADEINSIQSGLGDAAAADIGTGENDVAAGDHNHDSRYYTKSEVDDQISNINLSSHNHDERYYKKSEMDTALAGKASTSHTHDNRYYTENEVDSLLAGKANSSHNHDSRYYTKSEIDSQLNTIRSQILALDRRVSALEGHPVT